MRGIKKTSYNFQQVLKNIYSILKHQKLDKLQQEFPILIDKYNSCLDILTNKILDLKNQVKVLESNKAQFSEQSPKYKQLNQKWGIIYQKLNFTQHNFQEAQQKFKKFTTTRQLNYLSSAVKLLQTALEYIFIFKCKDCHNLQQIGSFKSNDRFCAFSNHLKVQNLRRDVGQAIDYLEQIENKTFSFLTHTLQEVPKLTKEMLVGTKNKRDSSLSKLIKEFFRFKLTNEIIKDVNETFIDSHGNKRIYFLNSSNYQHLLNKRVSDIFTGYFQVLEVKSYKKGSKTKNGKKREQDSWNIHFHSIVTRSKSKKQGFIPEFYLKLVWKQVSQKFARKEFKNSYIIDIGAKHLKNKFQNTSYNAANYILQYITKGISVHPDHKLQLYDILDGVRLYRSGGDLSAKTLKNIQYLNQANTKKGQFFLTSCFGVVSSHILGVGVDNIHSFKSILNSLFKQFVLKMKPTCFCDFCGSENLCYHSVMKDPPLKEISSFQLKEKLEILAEKRDSDLLRKVAQSIKL